MGLAGGPRRRFQASYEQHSWNQQITCQPRSAGRYSQASV